MIYQKGMELICIRTLKRKEGQINFIKGETYMVEDTFQRQPYPNKDSGYNPIYIVLRNVQGSLQTIKGAKKTKFFKIKTEEIKKVD
jgi:hypothetical protein